MNNHLEEQIVNICRNEYLCFLCKSTVVGIGYGNKIIKEIRTCEPCIQVFVNKKVSI